MKFPSLIILASWSLMVAAAFGQSTDGGMVVTGLTNNKLTESETKDGYELLWNGKDFTGWLLNDNKVNPGQPQASSNWAIVTTKGWENGERHKSVDPDSNMLEVIDAGSSIFTKDPSFLNFDYKVEWKTVVNQAGNAGLLYYFQIATAADNNPSAAEYQILNSNGGDEWKMLLRTAGCNYYMNPLLPGRKNADGSPSWCRKQGGWNQSRIISFGGHAAHYGNGLRLVEYQKGTPAYEEAYRASKFKTWPVYRTIHAGSFMIQDHGQAYMKFRNVRAKRLNSNENPWGPESPYLNLEAAAKGDSTLIDTLSFDRNLVFPDVAVNPYTIAPRIATQVRTNGEGLSIRFSEPGDYTLTLDDVKGTRYSVHRVRGADRFFLPGRFSSSPRVLSIWKGNAKIQETVVGIR
jgi:hypothetical protein